MCDCYTGELYAPNFDEIIGLIHFSMKYLTNNSAIKATAEVKHPTNKIICKVVNKTFSVSSSSLEILSREILGSHWLRIPDSVSLCKCLSNSSTNSDFFFKKKLFEISTHNG